MSIAPPLAAAHLAAVCCLGVFGLIGAVDGVYFHLLRYRLHQHPDARLEHGLHTARAFLFAPIAYFIYWRDFSGWPLLLGILFVALDLLCEAVDVLVERRARARLGGVSSAEALVHVMATGFRMASLGFILATKPAGSWTTLAGLERPYPLLVRIAGGLFLASSLWGGLSMLWLTRAAPRTGGAVPAVGPPPPDGAADAPRQAAPAGLAQLVLVQVGQGETR